MDIIETIKSRYDGLTKKQKKIADVYDQSYR